MPPPMPNPSKRITANPIRPARYRPGKAVPEQESSDEDEEEVIEDAKKSVAKSQPRAPPQRAKAPAQQVEDEDDDEEGFITEEEDEPSVPAVAPALRQSSTSVHASTPTQIRPPTSVIKPPSEDGQEDDESEEEEESSEEESSSEDEAPQRKFQRPVFVRKADRNKASATATNEVKQEIPQAASSTPDIDEQTRRLAQADLYIKDKLERDAIARAQGRKAWDDDDELDPEAMVDDTDGVDPDAEHAAWKLRELKRLKRDREAIEAREKEIEEIERRRNLTQEERAAEDREYLDKQKEDKDDRGKANYLAKYHHKGAFFQDDEMAQILKKRDIMGARFEDEITDKSVLPEYMRVRDMTKLGKKGRTRYTDLRSEDTGRFGDEARQWKDAGRGRPDGLNGTMDLRGVDERFLPDRDRNQFDGGRDTQGPTGANASAVGQRRERKYSKSRSRSPRRRRDDSRERGDSYRPRRRSYSRSRSRSRSRTPPRRKRSPSPYAERDKRRRVEVD